ncbi:MAG: rhodanese-like domain-containing protein, partial [Nannocystaceae bacterium]
MMHVIVPAEAARTRGLVLVDLRPTAERHLGIGFIPGSVGVPASDDPRQYAESISQVARERVPVLVCTSGTRACDRALQVAPHLRMPLAYLEGGVLGWAAAGLPLCGCV